MTAIKLKQLDDTFTYLRYEHDSWPNEGVNPTKKGFLACLKDSTAITLIVSDTTGKDYPLADNFEKGFGILEIKGPLEFSLVGILKELTALLAERNIPVCALSTYDTDMLLIAQKYMASAIEVIREKGHQVSPAP